MINKSIKDIERFSGGKLINFKDDFRIRGVSTDSRSIKEGNLFVPLVGENFDGHKFLEKAIENGASASFWQEDRELPKVNLPLIIVKDSLKALQELAHNYRKSLDLKLIAITGSNGKTTSKDIIDGVLSQKYRTKKTFGNLNNHIGVPLTLLDLDEDTEISIVEMGTDGFGQIKVLTDLALPDYAIITNIGDSHLEDLGSKENVARAKFEILDGLKEDSYFIYNSDDPILNKIIKEYNPKKTLNFGYEGEDYRLELLSTDNSSISFRVNSVDYRLPMIGRHNVYNASLAIILGELLGLSPEKINEGFQHINKTAMRNEIIEAENFSILNDAYKSNPNSLMAALDTINSLEGYSHKYLILGDMLGLGEDEEKLHLDCGRAIDPEKIDLVFTYGDLGEFIARGALENFPAERVLSFKDKDLLSKKFLELVEKDSLVLVKASRYMTLEDIIEKIR